MLALKVRFPSCITILRGNHESRNISSWWGFQSECVRKYGNSNVWTYCNDVFDYLPIAALVENRIFCVHGGLSPEIRSLDQIRLIDRFQDIPYEGAFSDMLWSDPEDIETWAMSPRGAGWLFGYKVADEFWRINGLELIARSLKVEMGGYRYWFSNSNVLSIWSAPNYWLRMGNIASILKLDENWNREIVVFEQAAENERNIQS